MAGVPRDTLPIDDGAHERTGQRDTQVLACLELPAHARHLKRGKVAVLCQKRRPLGQGQPVRHSAA